MRIGMILDLVFPPDPRVENEAVSLINSGHQVFLFCLTYDKNAEDSVVNGIQVKRYLSNKLEYKLSALTFTFPFYKSVMKKKISHFLVENKIDIIHIHDIQIAEASFDANKKLNLPTVLDLHENRPEIMKLYPHLRKFPGKQLISIPKWKNMEGELIEKANRVVVVTEESKDEIIKRTGKNADDIIVVPNTVRKSFYKDANIDDEIINKFKDRFVLLYLGNTGLRRGLQTAIDSIKLLKEKIPNVLLLVVGKSSEDVILKKQVSNLNIENYVNFQGWQSEKLFPSFIETCDICISPLHRNLHHDTTYANKIFQYMSFSKPVLVSDATSQKNLIENANSGLIHEERNSQDFADMVIQLYNDEKLRISLGRNGREFIENEFNWEQTSKRLIKLYDDLVN